MQVIAVDNVLVRPGDYILADDDGVVVIPMGVAPMIAELAIECVPCTILVYFVFLSAWHGIHAACCMNASLVEPAQCSHLR
jgi:hypothetical protein|eukprot:COSAG02_NODE_2770_length_8061_cov_7.055639_3_plen_81_part_00